MRKYSIELLKLILVEELDHILYTQWRKAIMLKIVGLFMIVASCSAIGFSLSKNYKKRVDSLKSFLTAFNMIKSELLLNNSSRRDLFKSVIEQCNGEISDYFVLLNKEDDGIILEESSLEYLKKMELKSAEISEIYENLCIIGKFDLSTQQELIDKSIKRLELMVDNATLEMMKNGKLYKALGLSSGLIIGLLML